MKKRIREIFDDSIRAKKEFLRNSIDAVQGVIECTVQTLRRGNTILLFGNGGSAADAQHIAAEFVNRFKLERAPLPAIALTTDTSALTSIANDFGYNYVFSKQVEALGRSGDLAFAFSTSGNSPSIIRAVAACRKRGIATVGFTGGSGGKLAGIVDHNLCVSATTETARIQETHILVGHAICDISEVLLASPESSSK